VVIVALGMVRSAPQLVRVVESIRRRARLAASCGRRRRVRGDKTTGRSRPRKSAPLSGRGEGWGLPGRAGWALGRWVDARDFGDVEAEADGAMPVSAVTEMV